jgi:hypothetical protein
MSHEIIKTSSSADEGFWAIGLAPPEEFPRHVIDATLRGEVVLV